MDLQIYDKIVFQIESGEVEGFCLRLTPGPDGPGVDLTLLLFEEQKGGDQRVEPHQQERGFHPWD